MTAFAISVLIWRETDQATSMALYTFCYFFPNTVFSLFAGVLIDRFSRKIVLIVSDLLIGLSTLVVLSLYFTGGLELWHLYVLAVWAGILGAFQVPAFSASITMLVPKEFFTRANAMRNFSNGLSDMLGPLFAGLLLGFTSLPFILLIDLLTCLIAVVTLLVSKLDDPVAEAISKKIWSFQQDVFTGMKFLWVNRGLMGLTIAFSLLNLIGTMGITVAAPMILARTNGNEQVYSLVSGAIGLGAVLSGILFSMVKIPNSKTRWISFGIILGSFGLMMFGLAKSTTFWVLWSSFAFFWFPVVGICSIAIKQSIVPPAIQGRVFSTVRFIHLLATSFAILLAGPLADFVFEPGMQNQGGILNQLSWLVSQEAGAGMSLMIVVSGVLGILLGCWTLVYQPIRMLETKTDELKVGHSSSSGVEKDFNGNT